MADEKEVVLNILKKICRDKVFDKFEYKNEFLEEWIRYISNVDNNVKYFILNESEEDQVYIFTLPIANDEMNFCFSIKYIRDFYLKFPNYKQKLKLNNYGGRLYNGENECCYTLICDTDSEKDYKDDSDVFVIPFSYGMYSFLVVDGNHRINQKINRGDTEFETLYVDYRMAALSLATTMQICAYCIMEDYSKITYNLNKYDHKILLKSSNIMHKERILNTISDRKR